MAPKNRRRTIASSIDPMRHFMKMATSDECVACKQPCSRGMAYVEKMKQPGAIGYGVPCILTKGKPGGAQRRRRR